MRKALYIFCAALALGCFLYAGAWFLGAQAQKDKDRRLAEQFHDSPAAAASPIAATPSAATPSANAASSAQSVAAEPSIRRFERLRAINPDVIGWITIEGTAIDSPVVRGEDNEIYLTTDFQGDSSKRGSIFMDYRCTEDSVNQIIYGHHMKDGTMFHDLTLYQDPGFLKEHPDIRFYPISGEEEIYRVVDVLYWDTSQNHGETFFEHMSGLDYDGGKLISLTTCDNAQRNIRVVVVARMAA